MIDAAFAVYRQRNILGLFGPRIFSLYTARCSDIFYVILSLKNI